MKYTELKGLFVPKRKDREGWFTLCADGVVWTNKLNSTFLSKYSEEELKYHFESLHDNLTLPLEFIS